ncbi:hypothetical protein MMC26_001986 [Xylographa opegraphella]|nr:hypothetical protein [Xylographa opegraphella]
MSSNGVRTRGQRIAAAAAGYPPTPPQALPMSTRVPRVPKLKQLPKKDEVTSRETTKSSLPPVNNTPTLRKPFFSQDLSLVHIWLNPTNILLKSKALYPHGEATVKIAVPLDTIQDFLRTLEPGYQPNTVPFVAYTVAPAEPEKTKLTNLSRRMKAAKRKLAETEAALDSSNKRAKTVVKAVRTAPALPAVAFEGPPVTVMQPKPPVRVPLGHHAYDMHGNYILMPYKDQEEDLIMPDQIMKINTSKKGLMGMFKEHEKKKAEKTAAAALKAQETLTAGTSVVNVNDSGTTHGGPSAPTYTEGNGAPSAPTNTEGNGAASAPTNTEGVNTSQVQGQSGPVDGSGTVIQTSSDQQTQQSSDLHAQTHTPRRAGFLGNLVGSVRRLVPGLHRPQLDTIIPGVAEASQTTAPNGHGNANPNNTSATGAPFNNPPLFTHQSLSTNPTSTQVSFHGKSLRVPKPTLLLSDAHQKADHEKLREAAFERKAKETRENAIQDEVARRVKEQLAALTGTKRKRYSPNRIPNPVGTSYGMDAQFFASDSESDEDDEEFSRNNPSLHPAKRQCSTHAGPSTPIRQIIGDPHRATPYTGTIFADPKNSNIFNGVNRNRSFVVPQSSSDEHSDGIKTTAGVFMDKGKGKEVQFSDQLNFSDQPSNRGASNTFHPSMSSAPLKSAMKASTRPAESSQEALPPSPTRAHATLLTATTVAPAPSMATPTALSTATFTATPAAPPTATFPATPEAPPTATFPATLEATPTATSPATPEATPTVSFTATTEATPTLPMTYITSDTDALTRVRSDALRFTPVVPSGLREASRLSSSIVASPADADTHGYKYEDTTGPSQSNEVMDQEVRAAVDAIAVDDLAEFEFPVSQYGGDHMDPAVLAALDAAWSIEDEHRAQCVFNDTLPDWIADNVKEPLSV